MDNLITRQVLLTGITDIMFDRYAGDNKTQLPVEQKMYLRKKTLILPSANISSFLSAQNTPSAPKRLMDSRTYKRVAQAFLSFVSITPNDIPFLRDGKPIIFNGFDDKSMYVHQCVARLDKGIPNPKTRPVLMMPWSLEFTLNIFPNDEFNEGLLKDTFNRGGIAVGLGTYRGVFGKFKIDSWK